MALISLIKATKDFGLKPLFTELDLYINKNERLGLIGANGSGKSTLLKVLAGKESLLSGQRVCSSVVSICLVGQENKLNRQNSIIEEVLKGCGQKRKLLLRFNEITEEIAKAPEKKNLLQELGSLSNLMDASKAWNLEQECQEILRRLYAVC